ncbi:MAG: hypothetical protein RIR48_1213 [Bacteroidota bacterium]
MKGIYLTEEGKKVIEDKIAELENYTYATQNIWIEGQNSGMLKIFEEILSSATIVPVEKNWDGVFDKTFSQAYIEKDYPNGVIIIQPKQ